MEIEYEIDRSDYLAYVKFLNWHAHRLIPDRNMKPWYKRPLIRRLGAWSVVALMLVILFERSGWGQFTRATFLASCFSAIIAIWIFSLALEIQFARLIPRRSGVFLGLVRLGIMPEHLQLESKWVTSTVKWPAVAAIDETDEYIFVLLDRPIAHMIPKRCFETEQDQKDFMNSLRTHAAAAT